jgi:thiamine biosynthesis lipoprotein
VELALSGRAVATSAGYFSQRRHRLRRVTAILDPRTRRPMRRRISVSVFAPSALLSDALTKVVAFSRPEVWQPLLRAEGASAVVLRD